MKGLLYVAMIAIPLVILLCLGINQRSAPSETYRSIALAATIQSVQNGKITVSVPQSFEVEIDELTPDHYRLVKGERVKVILTTPVGNKPVMARMAPE